MVIGHQARNSFYKSEDLWLVGKFKALFKSLKHINDDEKSQIDFI